ncbi:MAG TPA: hypothetical protein VK911_10755 [Vicinamibacterales bacterium]|nr:hypothetical protein [Vicinamibacterales bacterium]
MRGAQSLLWVVAGSVVLTGCKPSIGQPLPLEEAQQAVWNYPAYEMTPSAVEAPSGAGRPIQAEGRLWVGYDAADRFYGPGYGTRIPAAQLRSIGTSDGVALYVRATDEPPYGRLYSPIGEGRWRVYSSITR